MMDELELLKKDWQNKGDDFPKLSYNDIHKMIWKKSSSIVRWILIISILEFTLPHLLYLVPAFQDNMEVYDRLGLHYYITGLTILTYFVALYFIYQFYRRYKEISVLDNSKSLMRKIIKTRSTVKHYIIYSLSMILVIIIMMIIGIYLNDDITATFPKLGDATNNIPPEKLKISLMVGIGIFGVLLTLLMAGIYFLLYGLLLRKLKVNYKELKQLEI